MKDRDGNTLIDYATAALLGAIYALLFFWGIR